MRKTCRTSAPAATNVANTLLSGGGSNNFAGILNNSYGQLQGELNPYASGSMIGKNDALQPELNTIGNDVQNSTQGQFRRRRPFVLTSRSTGHRPRHPRRARRRSWRAVTTRTSPTNWARPPD